MNTINAVKTPNVKRGEKIGSALGLGAGVAYVAKNSNDMFVRTAKLAMEKGSSAKLGYAMGGVSAAIILVASSLLGKVTGGLISKASTGSKQLQNSTASSFTN